MQYNNRNYVKEINPFEFDLYQSLGKPIDIRVEDYKIYQE